MTDPEEPPIDPEEPPVLPPRPDHPADQTFIIHREPYTDENGVQTWRDTQPMTPETYAALQEQLDK